MVDSQRSVSSTRVSTSTVYQASDFLIVQFVGLLILRPRVTPIIFWRASVGKHEQFDMAVSMRETYDFLDLRLDPGPKEV